jgi:hypothetical protein
MYKLVVKENYSIVQQTDFGVLMISREALEQMEGKDA